MSDGHRISDNKTTRNGEVWASRLGGGLTITTFSETVWAISPVSNHYEHGSYRKYAAEQGIAVEEVLKKGREAKSKESAEKGSELYANA